MTTRPKSITGAGFTLLEVIFVMALVAILAAIATPLYRGYQDRAKATDVISRYEDIRTRLLAEAPGELPTCSDLYRNLPEDLYHDRYVNMSLGFLPAGEPGRGEPILHICATAGTDKQVRVAAAALTMFRNMQNVIADPIELKAVVSFSVYFGGPQQLICSGALPQVIPRCGSATNGSSLPATRPPQSLPQANLQEVQVATPQTGAQPPQTPTPTKGKDKPGAKPTDTGLPVPQGTTGDRDKTPPQTTAQPQQPALTDPTSSQGTETKDQGNQGSNSGASGLLQQQTCQGNCRIRFPHGNSRAYRDCLAACR